MPVLRGLIARRILVNYRVRPEVAARLVPPPFKPKVVGGWALAGVCLIRLEGMRLPLLPRALGISSENAAHRIAVEWSEGGAVREGVFIPRRDTDSILNRLAGGRLFPGVQHAASFRVQDAGDRIDFEMRSRDGEASVRLMARTTPLWPADSVFGRLAEAVSFFAAGSCGWSPNGGGDGFEGVALECGPLSAVPLQVEAMESSFFADRRRFPPSSIEFDSALLLRGLPHRWRALGTLPSQGARQGGARVSRSAFFDVP
jgi:hypothetical protein